MATKSKIHTDKKGREFIKETFFVGGRMKYRKVYVTEGIPEDDFYERNGTDLDFYLNGDYDLMSSEKELNNKLCEQIHIEPNLNDTEDLEDFPF